VVITQKGHTVAIKIAGTTVISDGKAFLNIESTTGQHGDLHSSASVITNAITFTAGIQSCIMTANQTFTISGDAEGRTTAVLLDTGTTPYVPTFPSSITWNGGEPTWSGHRYWQITIISRDTYQTATAVGYGSSGSTPPTEAISLEGTSGSPMFHSVFAGTSPMIGGWKFDTDGNVYTYDGGGNIGGNGYTLHSTSTWNNITPSTHQLHIIFVLIMLLISLYQVLIVILKTFGSHLLQIGNFGGETQLILLCMAIDMVQLR